MLPYLSWTHWCGVTSVVLHAKESLNSWHFSFIAAVSHCLAFRSKPTSCHPFGVLRLLPQERNTDILANSSTSSTCHNTVWTHNESYLLLAWSLRCQQSHKILQKITCYIRTYRLAVQDQFFSIRLFQLNVVLFFRHIHIWSDFTAWEEKKHCLQ